MEVVLGVKTYAVREEWIDRWELLSNYREDVRSDIIEIPLSAGIIQKQMEKWIDLNRQMNINSKKEEKIRFDDVMRIVQYFMPPSGRYLEHIDFTTRPLEQRVKLIRELGSWRRDLEVQLVALGTRTIEGDPYSQLKTLADKLKGDTSKLELIEELAALARKIPIDFLYGLHTLAKSDWRRMPWEDAYSGYDLLKDEWHRTCLDFLRYYIMNRDVLWKTKDFDTYSKLAAIVDHIPVLVPSNLVRIFADRELLDPNEPGAGLMRLPANTSVDLTADSEIIRMLNRYSTTRVMPDLLNYQLVPIGIETVPVGRMVRDNYDATLPYELDAKFEHIRTPYAEIRPYIPDVEGYFGRLYEYAKKHSSWKTFRVIFNGIALFEQLTEVFPEKSLALLPILLDCVDPSTTYGVSNPMELLVERISQTLGVRCLEAMSTCIVGAMEKESEEDYIRTNMAEVVEEIGMTPTGITLGRAYLLQFCDYAIEQVEDFYIGSSETKWPILKA